MKTISKILIELNNCHKKRDAIDYRLRFLFTPDSDTERENLLQKRIEIAAEENIIFNKYILARKQRDGVK